MRQIRNNILVILICLLGGFSQQSKDGYMIENGKVHFIYPSLKSTSAVYLSGNFNGWAKNDSNWKMDFNKSTNSYILVKDISEIKKPDQSFYEFTFSVDDKLIDANPEGTNVINCAGYGFRYIIDFAN